MGRIKTQQIKRITFDLVRKHRESFTKDFDENKKKLEEFAEIRSKKLRNMIAGYVTRLVQREEIE
jgi:small subunit ribosomal protein S17e